MIRQKPLLLLLLLLAAASVHSQPTRLFTTHDGEPPYRIPALAQNRRGELIAVSDYRPCGSDIGFGAVDLRYRISHDQGLHWEEEQALTHGTGIGTENVWNFAYGDCAIVADRESDEVLVICVCGQSPYPSSTRQNPNRCARFRSHDGGHTWDQGEEITEQIYGLFDQRKAGPIQGLFITSGKICQSKVMKKDRYYRLYAAACTRSGVFVVYSDDFGENWQVLGHPDESPCPEGDESKCEELPDGSVLLSCRTDGRYFNVYHFEDVYHAQGKWDQSMKAPAFDGIRNACNGEILCVEAIRAKDLHPVRVLLQSVPFGPQRTHVGFYYKELTSSASTQKLSADWKRGLQVSEGVSAYSTMIELRSGDIGFLWEEGPANYHIDYRRLTLEEITEEEFF